MLPVATFGIIVKRQPFSDEKDTFWMGQGCSVEDAMLESAYRSRLPVARFSEAIAIIDGVVISKDRWSAARPSPGETLIISIVPGLPALPAIFAFLAASAPVALGLKVGGWLAIALSTAITVVGALTMMLLSPTPRQSNSAPDKKEDAVNSVNGVGNESRPYGQIPRLFGKVVNYFPPLATSYYTEISPNNHQYLIAVFCFGYGPVQISNVKIGTTPIEDFEGVEQEFRAGYENDAAITLYPAQVREQTLSVELKQSNGAVERRTEVDTDEISVDIVFPGGLQRLAALNARLSLGVEFLVEYKLASSVLWIGAPLSFQSESISPFLPATTAGSFSITGNTKVALRRSVRFKVDRGLYDVKISRTTDDEQSVTTGPNQTHAVDQSYLIAIRSHRNEHPINKKGLALLAVRIRASDQLNGVIDRLNCTVEPIVPIWNGSAWISGVTRSPAWAFTEVLRGAANDRPVADSRIDLDKLLEFDSYCTSEGITFDGAFESAESVYDRLHDITGTANSSVSRSSGPFSVVTDNERYTPIQHFTEANSWDFSSTKIFSRRPHALKVRFPNILTLRQWDEIYVYDTGYSASNATLFETVELPYTSTARQAYKRARRALFMARLRPELYSLTVDAEHIVATPGDLVRVVHGTMLAGIGASRVMARETSGSDTVGVTLEAPFTMDGTKAYALRFRLKNGNTLLTPVDTVAGSSAAFTITTPIVTTSGPAVDDLALFGISGSESTEMIVRSVEPGADLSARITLLDYSPEIFTSHAGSIPEFDPQITLPSRVDRGVPPQPYITSINSDESVLDRASDGTLISRILMSFSVALATGGVPVDDFQICYRPSGTDQNYDFLGLLPNNSTTASIAPVDDGVAYDIKIRSRFAGTPSAWTIVSHTVIGKATPPADVERMYRYGDLLTWPYPNPPRDLAGFLVRANYGTSQDWGAGRKLHPGVIAAPPFSISALRGTQAIMVKAVDTSGIESADAAAVTINLGDLNIANVVLTQSEAPAFTGTITGGADAGTQLEATLLSSPPFWLNATSKFWLTAANDFWIVSAYSELSYLAHWIPESGYLDDGILKIAETVVGDYTIDYRIILSYDFWGLAAVAFWGEDGSVFWIADLTGEFTSWGGLLGPFPNIANRYEIKITVAGGDVRGIISKFDLIVDVPDIEEIYKDKIITVAASGIRLTPSKSRRAIDIVNLTLQDDGGTAITLKIIDKNPTTGALIKAYDSAGVVTTASFDARTKAH